MNGARLRALMREHKLTRAQVAEILGEAIGERVSVDTVHAWLRPPGNRAHRNMPSAKLRILELALATRATAVTPAPPAHGCS